MAEFHLSFEMFSISPLQAYSFHCCFSNNSVITLLEGCLPRLFVAEVVIFFSILSFPTIQLLSFRFRGIVMLFFSPIISFCQRSCSFRAYPFNRSAVSIIPLLTGLASKCFHFAKLIFFSFNYDNTPVGKGRHRIRSWLDERILDEINNTLRPELLKERHNG